MILKRKYQIPAALILLCILFSLTPDLQAEQKGREESKAYKNAYSLILKEEWKQASKAFETFVGTYPYSHYADDARFWLCYCKEKLGQDPEWVFNCYRDFIKNNKHSKWTDDARSNMIRIGHQLVKSGKKEYEAAVKRFKKDQDVDVKLAALHALEDIGDRESLETIIGMYDNTQDIKLKARIINVLEDFNSPRAYAKLKDLAMNDKNPKLRRKAINSLSDSENENAAHVLKQIARKDPDRSIRKSAINSLEDLKANRGLPVLLELAKTEKEPEIQRQIIRSLENINRDEAVPALLNFARESKDQKVRKAAIKALEEIGSKKARQALKTIGYSNE